jgi:competence protein ComEC
MRRFLLGLCCGASVLALPWPTLPAMAYLIAGAAAFLVMAYLLARRCCRPRQRRGLLVSAASAAAGLLWSAVAHHAALAARLDEVPSSDALPMRVRIVSDLSPVPTAAGQGPAWRFRAVVLHDGESVVPDGLVLRLSWYRAPDLRRGDEWSVRAVLRSPWGYANPAGFDYERWLLGAGIAATGYIRSGTLIERPQPSPLQRFRSFLRDHLADSGLARQGILLALLTGDGSGIPDGQWEVFRITGTVHLMVISGLHVGLGAGFGFLLGRWCLVLPNLALWVDGRKAGCLGGLMLASAYVALSGAGLPALRAFVMAAAALALVAWGRSGALGGTLLLALTVLLLLEPLALHQQGFWLSFGAVAILLLVMGGRHGPDSRLSSLLRPQLALSLGMLPLVALHTGDVPWAGVPANLVAVPVVSLCVVPAVLAGGALAGWWPDAAGIALWLADAALGWVLKWLEWLAAAPRIPGVGAAPPLLLAQLAALWWLLGPPLRHLPVLAVCGALALAPRAPALPPGEYRVIALDVGQGAAALVDTRYHRLLFDTGPGFPGGFETGSAVVVPNLLATGRPRVDVMVLSHDHLDHTGGAGAVLAAIPVRQVLTSTPREGSAACHGRHWRWDGVDFHLLHLKRQARASENDRSCVLLVDNGSHRTLLTGDIGAPVEFVLVRRLLADFPDAGPGGIVHLLFAPHHGSGTSSSRALVRRLAPPLVFIEAARINRFGHPHPQVVARYLDVGAEIHQTGRDGALVWSSQAPDRAVRWRRDHGPYWRAQTSGR